MKFDIARSASSKVNIIHEDKKTNTIQFEIRPKSNFTIADLDHPSNKLSNISLGRFQKKAELDQVKIIGFDDNNFTASFKIKEAELLENGNFLIDAKLLETPNHRDKKWNRSDHIGKDFVDRHINDISELPKKFKASTIFDFEGFKAAKEHVRELQSVDTRYNYSIISQSSPASRRIDPSNYAGLNSGQPLLAGCDADKGFSCSGWDTKNENNQGFWTGNPWLVNVDASLNSPFYQATSYVNQDQVIESSISTDNGVPAWQWRNVWGTIEHQDGSLFDLNRETNIDVFKISPPEWNKSIQVAENINLNIGFEIDLMPGLIFFVPAGFWAKLDPGNWAGALGMSIRPEATAKLSGFNTNSDSYRITASENIKLESFSEECGEGLTCNVDLSIDISGGGTIDVENDQDLEVILGAQGTLVGRAGGIRNYLSSTGAAVVHDFQGFDRVTGGNLDLTIKPEMNFSVGLGIPENVADFFQGWLGNGSLASLDIDFELPLQLILNLDNISYEFADEFLPATVNASADIEPEIKILPDTILSQTVSLGNFEFGLGEVYIPNIL